MENERFTVFKLRFRFFKFNKLKFIKIGRPTNLDFLISKFKKSKSLNFGFLILKNRIFNNINLSKFFKVHNLILGSLSFKFV